MSPTTDGEVPKKLAVEVVLPILMYHIDVRRRSFQPRVSSSHILHLIVFSWSRHTLHVAIRVPHSISSCCFPPTITCAGDIAETAILRPTYLGICCEHHQARKICVILVATVSEGTVFHL